MTAKEDLLLDAIRDKIRLGDLMIEGTPSLEEVERGKAAFLSAIAKLLLLDYHLWTGKDPERDDLGRDGVL